MLHIKLFAIFLFLSIANCNSLSAKESWHFYFNLSANSIEFGQLDSNFKKVPKLLKSRDSKFHRYELEQFFGECNGGPNLFYFHALGGHKNSTTRKRTKILNEFEAPKVYVHFLWEPIYQGGFIRYKPNWMNTPQIGHYYAELFQLLMEMIPGKTALFCHSSGHRVLKGILEKLKHKNLSKHIQNVVMAAADIDVDTFHEDFKTLFDSSQIFVYTNQKDFGLQLAKIQRGAHTVGRNPKDIVAYRDWNESIYFIDATKIRTFKDQVFGIGHTQYKSNKLVFENINKVLLNTSATEIVKNLNCVGVYCEFERRND